MQMLPQSITSISRVSRVAASYIYTPLLTYTDASAQVPDMGMATGMSKVIRMAHQRIPIVALKSHMS